MANSEYQSGWPQQQVALPDIAAPAITPGGLLDGLRQPDWSLADSSLNFLFGPKVMADIDFTGAGTGKPESPPELNDAGHAADGPDRQSAAARPTQNDGPGVGEYYLPGLGTTYLEPHFADKVADFMLRTNDHGIPLQFTSGYRDPAKQAGLKNDPGAVTPADASLHSAGRGVDINNSWHKLNPAQQVTVLSDAAAAGLGWGGQFIKPAPDPGHFYYDPGTDRHQLIDRFTQSVTALRSRIPDR
jgi:hypothetical protein